MNKLLSFVLYCLVSYSIKSQAMTYEQPHYNMNLRYDNHGMNIYINGICDYRSFRAFAGKKISLKNWALDTLSVQRYDRVQTLICYTIQTVFSGPLSYSDMQDKYIEINNCTIDRLIVESGVVVHLSNVHINYLDAKYGSKVRFGDNCTIDNCTSKD